MLFFMDLFFLITFYEFLKNDLQMCKYFKMTLKTIVMHTSLLNVFPAEIG